MQRTKRAVRRFKLHRIWTTARNDFLAKYRNALVNQVTLAHRDVALQLYIDTDASHLDWSGVVTQVPLDDLSGPNAGQRHQPLALLSNVFYGLQLHWTTLEKAGNAIVAAAERMPWGPLSPD